MKMSPSWQSPSQLSWEPGGSMYSLCTEFSFTLEADILIPDLDGVRVEERFFKKYLQAHLEIINCRMWHWHQSYTDWANHILQKMALWHCLPHQGVSETPASALRLCLENGSVGGDVLCWDSPLGTVWHRSPAGVEALAQRCQRFPCHRGLWQLQCLVYICGY